MRCDVDELVGDSSNRKSQTHRSREGDSGERTNVCPYRDSEGSRTTAVRAILQLGGEGLVSSGQSTDEIDRDFVRSFHRGETCLKGLPLVSCAVAPPLFVLKKPERSLE